MRKRSIRVFYDKTIYTLKWLRPMILAKQTFESYGYNVTISGFEIPFKGMERIIKPTSDVSVLSKELLSEDYDIVFLAYHHSLPGLGMLSSSERGAILDELKRHCNCLIWLDTADSTGTCLFDVIPHVDRYLKKQMYVDKSLYSQDILGDRLYSDYYIKKYKFKAPETIEKYATKICIEGFEKIGLSWNIGLGDYILERKKRSLFLEKRGKLVYYPPTINRKINCHFRGTVSDDLYGFQRKRALDILKSCGDIIVPDYSSDVNHKEYIEELKQAQAVVSPFGYGEICIRDFESFIYGSALIKPDMDHVDTYPNWFKKDVTYLSVDWDFQTFNDLLLWLNTSEGKELSMSIAQNGQRMFIDYYNSESKKKEFVEHLVTQIELAEGISTSS